MSRKIDWESQIGRRLRLRDLHVLFTVAERGSMAKAAVQLGVSQPAVSEVIADLERALGVRLLDRRPQGVEPTIYGHALLKRGKVAFDELKQGIRDIESLADPTVGELRIGCAESITSAIVTPVIERFLQQYPRVVLHVHRLATPMLELPELRERVLDIVLTRIATPLAGDSEDLNADILFNDQFVIATGMQNRWARRRKIDLPELAGEPWILTPPDSLTYMLVGEAFRARGLNMPTVRLMTFSLDLRARLLATGPFITALQGFLLRLNADRFPFKILPVELPTPPWPIVIVTLKNRTLNPVAQLFIDHVRAFTSSIGAGPTLVSAQVR